MIDKNARALGQIYTAANPFQLRAFQHWAAASGLPNKTVLEPFAGAGSLIKHLQALGYAGQYQAYDIAPASPDIKRRDTLADFPSGYQICITNPPWLAKNSATVRGLPFPNCAYDDLYKLSLSHCLAHCDYVAALVPEAFIRSGLFHSRLWDFVSIRSQLFCDTAHPTGLALFGPDTRTDIQLWADDKHIGGYYDLKSRYLPVFQPRSQTIRFNLADGNLGLIGFDNVREPSIRFCRAEEIAGYEIKHTSRFITRIGVDNCPPLDTLNDCLQNLRAATKDVFLSSYRGLRKDGQYRRRLDYTTARALIIRAMEQAQAA